MNPVERDLLAEAIAACNIGDLIAERYPDARFDTRQSTCSAPWRGGTDPTSVSLKDGRLYYDFVLGEGGSVWDFLVKVEMLDKREAAEYLLERAGLATASTDPEDAERRRERRKAAEADRAEREQVEAKREADKRADRLARALQTWRDAEDVELYLHPYLKQKGFALAEVPGVRIGANGSLLIPASTVDGEFRGLQYIRTDGGKRYLIARSGIDAAAFFTFGELDITAKHVAIVEGFATGLSVWRSRLYDAVLVAFDTNGLAPVGRAVREHYGEHLRITYAADNDAFFKGSGVYRTPLNAGIRKAHLAALDIGATVATPVFTGLDLAEHPTDFNDLEKLAGIDEVRRQLQADILPSDADAANPRDKVGAQHADLLDAAAALDLGNGDKLVYIDERYISRDTLEHVARDNPGALIFLESPLGTGKTSGVVAYYDGAHGLQIVSPLIALAAYQATLFAALNYQLMSRDDFLAFGEDGARSGDYLDRVAIVVNSLFKLARFIPPHVFIDEADAITHRLADPQLANPLAVFETLRDNLKQAQTAVLASAYLDRSVVELAKMSRRKIVLVRNLYQPARGSTYQMYANKQALLERGIIPALQRGERVAVPTDSPAFGKAVAKRIAEVFGDSKKVLYLDADSKGGDEQQDFLAAPNEQTIHYDAIIYTPVLGSGVSIDAGHGFEVFGYLCGLGTSPRNAMQLLHRFREVGTLHLAVDGRRQTLDTDPATLAAANAEAWQHNLDLMSERGSDALKVITGADGARRYGFRDAGFERLYSVITAVDNAQRLDFRRYFFECLHATGRREVGEAIKADKADAETYTETSEDVRELDHIAVSEAADITPEEYDTLDSKHAPTPVEVLQMRRYRLLGFHGLAEEPPDAPTVVELARASRRNKRRVERLTIARASDETLDHLARGELAGFARETPNVAPTQFALYDLRRELDQTLLQAARIDANTLEQSRPYAYADIKPTLEHLAANRQRYLKVSPNLPTKKAVAANVAKAAGWFGLQIRQLGFATTVEADTTTLTDAQRNLIAEMLQATENIAVEASAYHLGDKRQHTATVEALIARGYLIGSDTLTLDRERLAADHLLAEDGTLAPRTAPSRRYRATYDPAMAFTDSAGVRHTLLELREKHLADRIEKTETGSASMSIEKDPTLYTVFSREGQGLTEVKNQPESRQNGTTAAPVEAEPEAHLAALAEVPILPYQVRRALAELDHLARTPHASLDSPHAWHYRRILAEHGLEDVGLLRASVLSGEFDDIGNAELLREYVLRLETDPSVVAPLRAYAAEHLTA